MAELHQRWHCFQTISLSLLHTRPQATLPRWKRQRQLLKPFQLHQKQSRQWRHPVLMASTHSRYTCILCCQQQLSPHAYPAQSTAFNCPLILQGMPPRPDYYVAAPPGPPMYPAQPVYQQQQQAPGSTIPWWVWMGAGFLAANVTRMVSSFCIFTRFLASTGCVRISELSMSHAGFAQGLPHAKALLNTHQARHTPSNLYTHPAT